MATYNITYPQPYASLNVGRIYTFIADKINDIGVNQVKVDANTVQPLKKYNSSGSAKIDLVNGDIVLNQKIEARWDGTDFILCIKENIKHQEDLGTQASAIAWNHANGMDGFKVTLTGNATFDVPSNPPALGPNEYKDVLVNITASGGDYVPIADVIHKNFQADLILDGTTAIIAGIYDGTSYVWGAAVIV